jgi:hypothetical protein
VSAGRVESEHRAAVVRARVAPELGEQHVVGSDAVLPDVVQRARLASCQIVERRLDQRLQFGLDAFPGPEEIEFLRRQVADDVDRLGPARLAVEVNADAVPTARGGNQRSGQLLAGVDQDCLARRRGGGDVLRGQALVNPPLAGDQADIDRHAANDLGQRAGRCAAFAELRRDGEEALENIERLLLQALIEQRAGIGGRLAAAFVGPGLREGRPQGRLPVERIQPLAEGLLQVGHRRSPANAAGGSRRVRCRP